MPEGSAEFVPAEPTRGGSNLAASEEEYSKACLEDARADAAARNLETTAKIDQFSSILFGAVAPEGEPREALATRLLLVVLRA